jgi:hypothetical protein
MMTVQSLVLQVTFNAPVVQQTSVLQMQHWRARHAHAQIWYLSSTAKWIIVSLELPLWMAV